MKLKTKGCNTSKRTQSWKVLKRESKKKRSIDWIRIELEIKLNVNIYFFSKKLVIFFFCCIKYWTVLKELDHLHYSIEPYHLLEDPCHVRLSRSSSLKSTWKLRVRWLYRSYENFPLSNIQDGGGVVESAV